MRVSRTTVEKGCASSLEHWKFEVGSDDQSVEVYASSAIMGPDCHCSW
jgi:hypothetical protein